MIHHKQAGYTLTEMLIVLLLLSLMTAIGPVAIQKLLPSVAVNSAAQTLLSDLHTLRVRALISGSEGQLRIDKEGGGYSLQLAEQIIRHRKLGNAVIIIMEDTEVTIEGEKEESNLVIHADASGRLSGIAIRVERAQHIKRVQINPVFGTAEMVSTHEN